MKQPIDVAEDLYERFRGEPLTCFLPDDTLKPLTLDLAHAWVCAPAAGRDAAVADAVTAHPLSVALSEPWSQALVNLTVHLLSPAAEQAA